MDASLTVAMIAAMNSNSDAWKSACTSSSNVLSTCYANIVVENCSGTVTCDTQATQYTCSIGNSAALMAGLTAEIAAGVSGAADQLAATLKTSPAFSSLPPSGSISTDIQTYINFKCNAQSNVSQSVQFPSIVLKNCSKVHITAMNQLDSNAQCALGQAGQLIRAAGLGTLGPASSNSLSASSVFVIIGGVVVGMLTAAILIGLLLRKVVAKRTANMNIQNAVQSAWDDN